MNTRNMSLRWVVLTFLALLIMSLPVFWLGCGFTAGMAQKVCQDFENLPLTEVSSQNVTPVFEDPGIIKVMHGFGSAKGNSGNYIKVEQSLPIPDYANKATVFLNGWRMNYLGDDQHVLGLGTLIAKIKVDPRNKKLSWNAVGVLRDDDGHEGFNLTYYYTVIAWNDAAVNLIVDHGNADELCKADPNFPDNSFFADSNGTTALSSFNSFIQNPNFPSSGTVAVLPRGFGFVWSGGDHHLLQMAYNLDHSEIFAENGKKYKKGYGETLAPSPLTPPASLVDSGFVSWNTYAIFKDNGQRKDYKFFEMVSGLGGTGVGVLHPPFSILPKKGEGGGTLAGGVESKQFVIENIPFEYAIPVLTGWELAYLTDDQHVKEVGIWIDEWKYEKNPGTPAGTLRYKLSSILSDNDSWPGHYYRNNVAVLLLRPVASGGGTIQRK